MWKGTERRKMKRI